MIHYAVKHQSIDFDMFDILYKWQGYINLDDPFLIFSQDYNWRCKRISVIRRLVREKQKKVREKWGYFIKASHWAPCDYIDIIIWYIMFVITASIVLKQVISASWSLYFSIEYIGTVA